MKRVPVLLLLLLLLFECWVTLTAARTPTLYPGGRVDKYNEGHRECEGDNGTPARLHHTATGSKISVKISGPIKIASTTRSTPEATEDPKIAEHPPRTNESALELPYKFPHRLLDRSSLTHALSRRTGGVEGVKMRRVGEGLRKASTSYVMRVILPLLFSFKLLVTAVAIFFVLLAIKKVLIASALLIPLVNNTKFNGHYIMDVKFPRAHEQYGDYRYVRAQPYNIQLERKVPYQYNVIPHPNGPQVYIRKVNTGVNTIGSSVSPSKGI